MAEATGNQQTFGLTTIITLLTKTDPAALEAANAGLKKFVETQVGAGKASDSLSMALQAGGKYINTYFAAYGGALDNTLARVKAIGKENGVFAGSLKTVAGALYDSVAASVRTSVAGFEALASVLGTDVVLGLAGAAASFAVVGVAIAAVGAAFYKGVASAASYVRATENLKASMAGVSDQSTIMTDNFVRMTRASSYASLGKNFEGWLKLFSAIGNAADAAGVAILAAFSNAGVNRGWNEDAKNLADTLNAVALAASRASAGIMDISVSSKDLQTDTKNPEAMARMLEKIGVMAGIGTEKAIGYYKQLKEGSGNAAAAISTVTLAATLAASKGGVFATDIDKVTKALDRMVTSGVIDSKQLESWGIATTDATGKLLNMQQVIANITKMAATGFKSAEARKEFTERFAGMGEIQVGVLKRIQETSEAIGKLTIAEEKRLYESLGEIRVGDGNRQEALRMEAFGRLKQLKQEELDLSLGTASRMIEMNAATYGRTDATIKASFDMQEARARMLTELETQGNAKWIAGVENQMRISDARFNTEIQHAQDIVDAQVAAAKQGAVAIGMVGGGNGDPAAGEKAKLRVMDAQLAIESARRKVMDAGTAGYLASQARSRDLAIQQLETVKAASKSFSDLAASGYSTIQTIAQLTGASIDETVMKINASAEAQISAVEKYMAANQQSDVEKFQSLQKIHNLQIQQINAIADQREKREGAVTNAINKGNQEISKQLAYQEQYQNLVKSGASVEAQASAFKKMSAAAQEFYKGEMDKAISGPEMEAQIKKIKDLAVTNTKAAGELTTKFQKELQGQSKFYAADVLGELALGGAKKAKDTAVDLKTAKISPERLETIATQVAEFQAKFVKSAGDMNDSAKGYTTAVNKLIPELVKLPEALKAYTASLITADEINKSNQATLNQNLKDVTGVSANFKDAGATIRDAELGFKADITVLTTLKALLDQASPAPSPVNVQGEKLSRRLGATKSQMQDQQKLDEQEANNEKLWAELQTAVENSPVMANPLIKVGRYLVGNS